MMTDGPHATAVAGLASELQVVAPVSVHTLLTRRALSVRRAHTLPRVRVAGVLGVRTVTGCTAAILVGVEATCTPVASLPSHAWDAGTLAFL